jgi:hypothetical protein
MIKRQGDVALIPTKISVKGQTDEKRVVAYGEVSGHHHVLVGDAKLITSDGRMYVVAGPKDSYLAHLNESDFAKADHHPVKLEPNTTYEVRLQNQYNPLTKLMEKNAD